MKQTLLSLAALMLILGGTASGGGWESSGSRAASPAPGEPGKGPFNFSCALHVDDVNGETRKSYDLTQILTDDQFRNGRAEFETTSPSYAFLQGHKISLGVTAYPNGEEFLNLFIEINRSKRTEKLSVSSSARGPRSSGLISASANLTITPRAKGEAREYLRLSVTCAENSPQH